MAANISDMFFHSDTYYFSLLTHTTGQKTEVVVSDNNSLYLELQRNSASGYIAVFFGEYTERRTANTVDAIRWVYVLRVLTKLLCTPASPWALF